MAGRLVGGAAAIGSGAATVMVALPAAYLLALTVRGAQVARRTSPPFSDPGGSDQPPNRFIVCVPAHDEESIISSTVEALLAQTYPANQYSINVVADNCSDDTAAVAAAAGATVHERTESEQPGKGPALNWLFDRLHVDEHDVLVVVDADTVAEPGFLAALDAAFMAGAEVAQGHYGVRDPHSSPAVALRYAALACRHHLRPLARNSVGASCGLYGNGMAFKAGVLRERSWSGHLIEDAEFQMALLLDGITVTYVPRARIAAEMPCSFEAAATQNERWELGRWQLVRRFVPDLLQVAVTGGRLRRHVYLDAAMDHLVPPLSGVAAIDIAGMTIGGLATVAHAPRSGRVALVVSVLSGAVLVAHVLTALWSIGAPRSVYLSLAQAPRLVWWKLGLLGRVARRPAAVSWTRTTRNASILTADALSVAP